MFIGSESKNSIKSMKMTAILELAAILELVAILDLYLKM